MTTLPSWLLPALSGAIVALLLAGVSLIIKIVADVAGLQKVCDAHTEALKCIPELVRDRDRVLFRQETEDRVMGKLARDEIHSPNHPERDTLVDKLMLTKDITAPETTELIWRLELAMSQEKEPYRKLHIGFLLGLAYERQKDLAGQEQVTTGVPCKGGA